MIDEGRTPSEREQVANRVELERYSSQNQQIAADLIAAMAALDRSIEQAKRSRKVLAERLEQMVKRR